jgi:hypothetical protein
MRRSSRSPSVWSAPRADEQRKTRSYQTRRQCVRESGPLHGEQRGRPSLTFRVCYRALDQNSSRFAVPAGMPLR